MSQRDKAAELTAFEEKAKELVHLTFELCEASLTNEERKTTPSELALEAAAHTVEQSLKTLLAVKHIQKTDQL